MDGGDFNNSVYLVLPLVVVAATALLVLLADVVAKRKELLAWVAAGGLAVAAAVALSQWLSFDGGVKWADRQPEVGFAGMVALDKYSLFFTVLFCAVGIITILLSEAYLTARGASKGEFYALLLMIIAGTIGMAQSTDLVALFVSFELMSLPSYVMAGYLRGEKKSGEAAMKYFINGAFSSAILVFGFALLYGATTGTNYAVISRGLEVIGATNGLVIVALVFVVTAFGFKISAVPFHGWAPDVYQGAPTPVTAFMSVGVKAGAFAGLVKLFTVALQPAWDTWSTMLIILAVLTMVVGNVLALPQRNVKRMLAYSSIAHAGYLLLGVIAAGQSGDSVGSSAVLFYLAAYAFMNLGAFGILALVRTRRPGFDYSLEHVAGLGREMPWVAIAMTLFMLSLIGIPPLAGFWGKFYIFTAIIDADLTWLAVVAVVMSAVSAYYYLRVVWYMYFREAEEKAPALLPAVPSMDAGMGLALLGVVAVGLYPEPFIGAAQAALTLLLGG